ncbi:MAG: Cell division protein FtsL [Candidatus Dichloromethanomonas elyunquensis]|nr:MAG: Cell division protein FtsL [Candidatus Dichloromethanomonas elyunquensis]
MVMAQRTDLYGELYEYPYTENTEVVLPRKRKTAPQKKRAQTVQVRSLAMMLVIISIFGVIGAKTVHTNVVKGAEVRVMEKEIQNLNVEKDLLQVEVDKLRSIGRIEKAAIAMGMERPQGTIYVASNIVQPQKTVGAEQTPEIAAVPDQGKASSMVDNVFKILTSFFASTQR